MRVPVLLFIGLLSFYSATVRAERVELYDATLQDFVEWASSMLNKSVVVGSDIRSVPVSVFASYDTPADLEALVANTVQSAGLHYSATDRLIRISAAPIPVSPELITEVFQLQYLQSDFANQAVRDVLASRPVGDDDAGASFRVSPSPTTNAIIVTATEDQFQAVRRVLSEIDQPRRQVVITAVVAELADDDYDALGLNLSADSERLSASGVSLRASDVSDLGLSLTFSGPTLRAFLQAVKSTGNNRILSTPQLLTLNRESASIVVGQNVPFITGQTTSGSTPASDPFQTIVRQDVGVTLDVTPYITPSGSIELKVSQTASSVSSDRSAADIITNTRRISTRVHLQDGGGVLLGGLRSSNLETTVARVPLLSSVPLVGPLFRSTTTRARDTNLVVLLTARVHGEGDVVAVADPVMPLLSPTLGAAGLASGAAGGQPGNAEVAPRDVPVARQ